MAPSSRPPGFEPLIFVVMTVIAVAARGAIPLAESTVAGSDRVIRVAGGALPEYQSEIARLIARDLRARIEHVTTSPAAGGAWDLAFDGPAQAGDSERATASYSRSSHVFVTRRDRRLELRSLDDRRLLYMRIGIPWAAGQPNPPLDALAKRGIVAQVQCFEAGDGAVERIVEAVVAGDLDAGILWGPTAAALADRESGALEMTSLATAGGEPQAFTRPMALGVSEDRPGLKGEIDAILAARRPEIERILDAYGVPRVEEPAASPAD